MKKRVLYTSILLAFTILSGCSESPKTPSASNTSGGETSSLTDNGISAANSTSNSENKSTSEQSGEPTENKHSNILIAYFTWAENTYVEDPEKVDVDASTSASVLAPGNAAKLANWIQQEVGGDLFSIVVKEPYSSNYDECLDRAADEKAANARPELVNHLDKIEDYDIIFLGFPNWWYTVPMAIHSFIEEYDFSGKTVVPFVTHGTGGLAGTIKDITAALPDSVHILEPIGVYRPEVDASHDEVIEWLKGLELSKVTL